MLTKDLLVTNFFAFWLCSKLYVLPIDFNRRDGVMSMTTSPKKRFVWFLWLTVIVANSIFINFRLLQAILIPEKYFFLEQLPVHLIMASASVWFVYSSFASFIFWPDLNVMIFNELYGGPQRSSPTSATLNGLTPSGISPVASATHQRQGVRVAIGKQIRSQNENEGKRKLRLKDLSRFSIEELLIIMAPIMDMNCCNVLVAYYLLNPKAIHFMYSTLSAEFQNPWIMTLLLLPEFLIVFFWMSMAHYEVFYQISFFQKCMVLLQRGISSWRKFNSSSKIGAIRGWRMGDDCKMCQELQLELMLFNQSRSGSVYLAKLAWQICAVAGNFCAIKLFHKNPIVAGLNVSLGVYAVGLFIILYDKAFAIPEGIRTLKNEMLIATRRSRVEFTRDFYKSCIGSFSNVSIKVGSFQTMERASTPNFVLFITVNIFNLLVLFEFY